jgi:hypothetical protein
MHVLGYRRVPSHPTHTTHASAICEVRSTRSRAVGNSGHCIAHMATTHVSDERAEMPSGMVPLRELPDRARYLHPGRHIHTPGYSRVPSHPTYTTHASAICEVRSTRSRAVGDPVTTGTALHTWPPLTSAR